MNKIILIGFATSGKSSAGKLLADKLKVKFIDTDAEIERECDMSVQQIFDKRGEEYFRKKENDLLTSLASMQNVVVACGGGSVTAECFELFAADSVVIWLTATAATVASRLGDVARPLFDGLGEEQLAAFINRREHLYRRYANITLSTDSLTPEQIADELYAVLKQK